MQVSISPKEAAQTAVRLLGGLTKAARVLNVKEHRHQTVQSWLKTRVPAEYCPAIERETRGQVLCEHLRPDVDWGVLRGYANRQTVESATASGQELVDTTGAPTVPANHPADLNPGVANAA